MENDKSLALATQNELAVSTAVAAVTAEIKSCLQIAKMYPRNLMASRIKILETCKRPGFAPSVCYNKPIGGSEKSGISIRGAEVAANNWGNIKTMVSVVYDDDKKRILNIMSMDLETNTSYSKQITVEKIIERNFKKKGQIVVYERENTYGKKVYGIIPTSDEFDVKVAAQTSKQIRNNILRLIPEDIKDEMVKTAKKVMENVAAEDPQGEIKKIVDSFVGLKVMPGDLEEYIGHDVGKCSPNQIAELRVIYKTIKDGEAAWVDYLPIIDIENETDEKTEKQSRIERVKEDLLKKLKGDTPPEPPKETPNLDKVINGEEYDHKYYSNCPKHGPYPKDLKECQTCEDINSFVDPEKPDLPPEPKNRKTRSDKGIPRGKTDEPVVTEPEVEEPASAPQQNISPSIPVDIMSVRKRVNRAWGVLSDQEKAKYAAILTGETTLLVPNLGSDALTALDVLFVNDNIYQDFGINQ